MVDNSLIQLPGVGKQIAKHFARLNINCIQDLLFHFPSRYQDRTQIYNIRQLIPGQEALIEGVIKAVTAGIKRTKLLCELQDETGKISLRFFHVLSFQKNFLKVGTRLRCFSEVRLGPKGLEMIHPEFQVIAADSLNIDDTLTPIYPATTGISQHLLRKLINKAFSKILPQDTMPKLSAIFLQNLNFPSFKQALEFVHRPPPTVSTSQLLEHRTLAQQRLIYEELVAHRISLLQVKKYFQQRKSFALQTAGKYIENFYKQLPFVLTAAQIRVISEIQQDLKKSHPMLRLVQGDVGSGKTIVAAVAMLHAVENGHQAVMMVPTELLAEQHYQTLKKWFEPLGLNIQLLSGEIQGKARKQILASIKNGQTKIILGTHALFQTEVEFAQLALIVIDEQHRFGVNQRALLCEKGMQNDYYPHQLMMTATPIPRTLAMSFYANLDCSIIDELPPGRTPIITSVVANSRREEVIARVLAVCKQGRQVYWVCPLIDKSQLLDCQAAIETADYLKQSLPDFKIGLIHGRMRAEEKDAVMRAFQTGKVHLLVATTVIEVGVDVPNASLMIIDNAERLGLSQLHQLRGRVGRGNIASHCVLLYQPPLSALAKERLQAMRETTDGFALAERDLELRGPGEVLGTKQTGELNFRIADLHRDKEFLVKVQQIADDILQNHPDLMAPLLERWIGKDQKYGMI